MSEQDGFSAAAIRCCYLDDRTGFFDILGEKIGPGIELQASNTDAHEQHADSDVIIVGLSSLEDSRFPIYLTRLQHIVRNPSAAPVVVFLSTSDRQAMRISVAAGAYDFFVETGSMEELRMVLRRAARFRELSREVERLRSSHGLQNFVSIIGTDPKMRSVFNLASKVASTGATVLITGESGTGKGLLARAIHEYSARAHEPFVAVSCSALPEPLIESELFGHEKGAFTGAAMLRKGRFETAEKGTIFLDEISELSSTMQVKLLRVLQERTIERLGSSVSRPIAARVICATNQSLSAMVKKGQFRLDLFYRLNTVEINLPPLRERRDDIPILAQSFLKHYAERYGRPARRFSPAAMAALTEYEWPGNVRELQNVVESAVVLLDSLEVRMEHLPVQFQTIVPEISMGSFEDEVRNFKKRLIYRALTEYRNNKLQAARSLGIARSSLHRLIDELQVEAPHLDYEAGLNSDIQAYDA
jgi:DNA-binding NtrC family response regulator